MLKAKDLDNLYAKAFAFRKKSKWRKLPWDFMIGIKTKKYGNWYALAILDESDDNIGFIIGDREYGLPVERYSIDIERMDKASDYERESYFAQQHSYYFLYENKKTVADWPEGKWLQSYCDRYNLKCCGKKAYPSFKHAEPGFGPYDLENIKDVLLCEKFVSALSYMEELLENAELLPQQGQIRANIRNTITIPLLAEEADTWKLSEEVLPPAGHLNWLRLRPNDFDTARFKRFPKSGNIWQLEKFAHEVPDDDYEIMGKLEEIANGKLSAYVDALIIYDESDGHVILMDNFLMRLEGQNGVMSFLLEAIEQNGRPMKIIVGSEESYEFIREFCHRLSIQLVMEKVPQLEIIRDNVLAGREPMRGFSEEEWLPADSDEDWDEAADSIHNKNKRGKKKKSEDAALDMLIKRINSFIVESSKHNNNASNKFDALLKECTKSCPLDKMNDKMLEIMLNLAMTAPMSSNFFRTIVGEYQKRLNKSATGFLAIVDK